jgi:hypothetical protein
MPKDDITHKQILDKVDTIYRQLLDAMTQQLGIITDNMATKHDLQELRDELKAEFKAEIKTVKDDLQIVKYDLTNVKKDVIDLKAGGMIGGLRNKFA